MHLPVSSASEKELYCLETSARGIFSLQNALLSTILDAPADFTILVLSTKLEHTPHTWALPAITALRIFLLNLKAQSRLYRTISVLIAFVWLVNGLFCKVLNLVPRHQQIVEQILGTGHSRLLTVLIGISEIVMTIWVLSNYRSRINAITQMIVIGTMNILEFLLVPQLLLWGRFNIVFAIIFIALIYYNEFKLNNGTQ